jgi:hypothetical protein
VRYDNGSASNAIYAQIFKTLAVILLDKTMKIFLTLKHWQLFLIWILSTVACLILDETPLSIFATIIYFSLLTTWVFSIGKIINDKPTNRNKVENYNENTWVLCYLLTVVIFFVLWKTEKSSGISTLVLFGLGAFSGIKLANFSAKVLRQFEEKKELSFRNYLLEFLLIMYMVVGVWFLQPRLNRIMNET